MSKFIVRQVIASVILTVVMYVISLCSSSGPSTPLPPGFEFNDVALDPYTE